MKYNTKRSYIVKKLKYHFNVPINNYQQSCRVKEDKQTYKNDAENKNPTFSELFDTPKEVMKSVDLTNWVSLR